MAAGPQRKLFAHELAARLDDLLFASPSQRAVGGIADALETLRRAQQDLVLHWVGVAAKTQAEIGYLIATLAPAALARLDAQGFADWVLAGLAQFDAHGARAATACLRDLDGFCARHAGQSAVVYEEIEARLTRFVQGLSGRPLTLRAADAAWTDTETLHLPARLARMDSAEGNRALYKALAALLWAQVRFGTFGVDLEAALAVWPERERERALAWLAVFESVRLEARIGAELPGLAREIAAVRGDWPDDLGDDIAALSQPEADVTASLSRVALRMAKNSVPPTLPQLGGFDLAAAKRVRAQRIARDTEVLRKALAVLKGSGGQGGEGDPSYAPLAGDGNAVPPAAPDFALLPPDARAAAASLIQDLGELPPECLTPAGDGAWTPTAHEGAGPQMRNERAADRLYDEWDYHRDAYRRDWCQAYESDVPAGDPAFVAEVRERYAPLIRRIRRRFEALCGEDRRLKRQPDGEEIDLDALVEALADRRAGAAPGARCFVRRQRAERSVAAMFMVDMSGSTKGWINDAEREALVMLATALETLGDPWAVWGFSGWTRTRCDLYRIKSFAEPCDAAVEARIAGIEAKDYTRMGVAIRHLNGLLAQQPARHKLLITLSDGRPDDFGDEYRGHYGIEDTRRALQESRQLGIHPYCITIDRHGADYLRRMYGPARYVVIDDVKTLPLRVAEIYRKLAS